MALDKMMKSGESVRFLTRQNLELLQQCGLQKLSPFMLYMTTQFTKEKRGVAEIISFVEETLL